MAAKITPEYLLRDEVFHEVAIRSGGDESIKDHNMEELRRRYRELTKEEQFGNAQHLDSDEEFSTGIYAHPIFSKEGDYPPIVKEIVASYSKAEGLSRSRLPVFTKEQVDDLRGSADFFSLNHYTTLLASRTSNCTEKNYKISADLVVKMYPDPSWPGSVVTSSLKVYPLGIRRVLNWLRDNYGDVEILITENGFSTNTGLHDEARINYLHEYMKNVLRAIDDGVYVTAYTVWSLEDNFEWTSGYKSRFGLFEVDYSSPSLTRIARGSADYYKHVIATGLLDPTDEDIEDAEL